jgi:cytochrome oxidase Cu insertion factor (SCO1/SenC/PrrC family)
VQSSDLTRTLAANRAPEHERLEHKWSKYMMVRVARLFLMIALVLGRCGAQGRQQASTGPPAKQYFTDVSLVNQNGQRLRLYSDLLRGKIVVVNTFFTSCENSCPRMSAALSGLQERLGERLGNDVLMLSITVDPQNDTPAKLKVYADHFHAKPGWMFLTGTPEDVQYALSKFGQKVDQKEDHFNLYIIGREATGLWEKVLPMHQSGEMRTSTELMEIVDSLTHEH